MFPQSKEAGRKHAPRMKPGWLLLYLATGLLLLLQQQQPCAGQSAQDVVVGEFSDEYAWSDNKIPQFNNLVVDKNTGRVYIGAVNKLYQLSPDLRLNVVAVTGPKEDSPKCSVFPDCSEDDKELSNNVNKALLIDYSESRLISCGSLFQGICTVRNLRNISNVEEKVRIA